VIGAFLNSVTAAGEAEVVRAIPGRVRETARKRGVREDIDFAHGRGAVAARSHRTMGGSV
jgi:hypothetical protein